MFRYLLLPVITQKKTFMTIKNLLLSHYIEILAHSAIFPKEKRYAFVDL